MLQHFLRQLRCCLPGEAEDFACVRDRLRSENVPVAYMPSISWDFWPAFALQCTSARFSLPQPSREFVYLAPLGAHDFWAKSYFEQLVLDFYRNDELPQGNTYGFEAEEMLLLDYPCAHRMELAEFGSCSCVYVGLSHPSGAAAHVFFLMEDPSEGWNTLIRQFDIPITVLADSGKGLGDWFDSIPLSEYIFRSPAELRPALYFKGKFISHEAPRGCTLVRDISESGPHDCLSQLYSTNWRSFFFYHLQTP